MELTDLQNSQIHGVSKLEVHLEDPAICTFCPLRAVGDQSAEVFFAPVSYTDGVQRPITGILCQCIGERLGRQVRDLYYTTGRIDVHPAAISDHVIVPCGLALTVIPIN